MELKFWNTKVQDRPKCPPRQNFVETYDYCSFCHVKSTAAHLPKKEECQSNETCKIWYSTEHHKIFCRRRIKEFKQFIPMIDKNLISRFLDMFDIDEKYFIATSSPSAPEIVNLKPIKILNSFNIKQIDNFLNSDTIVSNDSMELVELSFKKNLKFLNAITSKTLICFPKILDINKSKLSPDMLLHLLSTCTKDLSFQDSICVPNISFTDIIKKAPNLESIHFYDFETNILNGNLWLDNLLEYSNAKNFRRLDIKVDAIEDIDAEKLKKFARTKCAKDVSISIHYDPQLMDGEYNSKSECDKFDQLGMRLLKHFDDLYDLETEDVVQQLEIVFDAYYGYQFFSLQNAQKDK